MTCAYQINSKTVAIFSAVYMERSTNTVFVNSRFVRDVFERLCKRVEEKATRPLFCKSVRHFLVKMSLRRASLVRRFRQRFGRIKSTVRPILSTERMAIFENWTAFCL